MWVSKRVSKKVSKATPLVALLVGSLFANPAFAADSDGDAVDDSIDNCSEFANPNQRDTDGDGFGNFCDADLNNDNIVNPADLGLFRLAFLSTDPDADFNGDGVVNPTDLGLLRAGFLMPPGPGAVAPAATFTNDVQPIFGALCGPCHTGLNAGGHDLGLATNYTDALLPTITLFCAGLNKGQCTIVRILAGQMPQFGCTGDPAMDAANPACLTQAQQDIVQSWVDGGLLE